MSACVHGATAPSDQPVSGSGRLNRALGCPAFMVLVSVMMVEMMMMMITIPLPGVCGGVQRRRRNPACARPLDGKQG